MIRFIASTSNTGTTGKDAGASRNVMPRTVDAQGLSGARSGSRLPRFVGEVPSLPIIIRSYRDSDRNDVVALWEVCDLIRPWNAPDKDIRRKQRVQGHLFLVAELDDEIVGSAMAGYDGHRGWVNYLATDPAYQRQGIATLLMDAAEQGLAEMGCPKINIQIRADNVEAIAFYESIGFTADDVINMGKRLEED